MATSGNGSASSIKIPGISLALNPGYLQRGRNRCQPSAFSRGTTSMRQQGRPVELTASKRTSKSCG
jgi:hypothetical protein